MRLQGVNLERYRRRVAEAFAGCVCPRRRVEWRRELERVERLLQQKGKDDDNVQVR